MNRILRKATRNISNLAKQDTTKETTEEDTRTWKDDRREVTQQIRSNAATSRSSPTHDTGDTSRQERAAPRRHLTAKQEAQFKRAECFKCGEHGHLARECPGSELGEAPSENVMQCSNSDSGDGDTEEDDVG
ncbi:BZ3500_MvSof-1268-A1-R1_Chr2-2g04863 [Microbotryum saponariae]|uniref:BZ3500_MvSof-1268-A1-R1_Chr2-2g04863 protein n=1 Tax=Microbotryum saponariae TaxID=289078 RepID=A0A2X0K5Q1_9BASI|nr:BZ3500_MvSof-1268-A1-R1_Chr2-2g04863 [Microbotryum saponariae]SDA00352.1 BZ3501_MvSof-1269-A2-R1_Chr2-2g04537 [Microbotryum saponariae]